MTGPAAALPEANPSTARLLLDDVTPIGSKIGPEIRHVLLKYAAVGDRLIRIKRRLPMCRIVMSKEAKIMLKCVFDLGGVNSSWEFVK